MGTNVVHHKYKHGHAVRGELTSEYRSWQSMMTRCYNENFNQYSRYGGRGVKVHLRWHDFSVFIEDMGLKPSRSYTIERIDNDKDYKLGNCKWASKKQQQRNKCNSRLVAYKGQVLALAEWADRAGISRVTFKSRLDRGWSVEKAMQPVVARSVLSRRSG